MKKYNYRIMKEKEIDKYLNKKLKGSEKKTMKNKDLAKGLTTKVNKLVKENEIKALAYKYADLENDFKYVVDINKQIADTYNIVFKHVPTSTEMEIFTKYLKNYNPTSYDKKEMKQRLKILKKFLSFIEAREKNNVNMKPKRYELPKEKK